MVVKLFGMTILVKALPIILSGISVITALISLVTFNGTNRKGLKTASAINLILFISSGIIIFFTDWRYKGLWSETLFWSFTMSATCLGECIFSKYRKQYRASSKAEHIGDSIMVIAFWLMSLVMIANIRYLNNIITLEPTVQTTVYYVADVAEKIDTTARDEIISAIEEDNVVIKFYEGLDGVYFKKTVTSNYKENRNVKPFITELVSTDTSYVLYLNPDEIGLKEP